MPSMNCFLLLMHWMRGPGRFLAGQGRKQHGRQDGDNRDDDQQLNQRERSLLFFHIYIQCAPARTRLAGASQTNQLLRPNQFVEQAGIGTADGIALRGIADRRSIARALINDQVCSIGQGQWCPNDRRN